MPTPAPLRTPLHVEPVVVTMVGTGDGKGTSAELVNGTTAMTLSDFQPNLTLRVVGPFLALAVRFIHLFLVTLVGVATAAMTPIGNDVMPFADFSSLIVGSSTLALTTASLGAIKDLVTIFGRLEGKFPLSTGQV